MVSHRDTGNVVIGSILPFGWPDLHLNLLSSRCDYRPLQWERKAKLVVTVYLAECCVCHMFCRNMQYALAFQMMDEDKDTRIINRQLGGLGIMELMLFPQEI